MSSVTRDGRALPHVADLSDACARPLVGHSDPVIDGARRLFYLGCFLVPLTAIRLPGGFAASDWVLFVSGLLTLMSLSRPKVRPSGWLVTASIFALGASVSVAMASSTPVTELAVGGRIVFVWGVWPVIAALVLRDRHHVGLATAFFAAGGCLSAIVAIAQLTGMELRGIFLAAPPDGPGIPTRMIGLNTNSNGQAGTLAIVFTIAVAALIYGQRRSLASAALVIAASGILLSGSITGSFMAAVGLTVLVARGKRLRTAVLLAVLAAPCWLLISRFQEAQTGVLTPFQRLASATGQTGINTFNLRIRTIVFAWERIVANPWQGVGLLPEDSGTFDGVTTPHNMVVLAWFQGGPLMLVAVLIAILTGLALVWRRIGDPLWEIVFAAVVCGLAFAQTGPALFDRYVWMPVVLAFVLRHQQSEID